MLDAGELGRDLWEEPMRKIEPSERDQQRWEAVPGLFWLSEVAEFADANRADQGIRAAKARTDQSGQDLYRVYVLAGEDSYRPVGSPGDTSST